MRMVAGKLARMVAAIVIVSFLTFVLSKALPGDPSLIVLGTQANAFVPCASGPHDTTSGAADCSGVPKDRIVQEGAVGPPPTLSKCTAAECITERDQFRHIHHLDEPVLKQYFLWAGGALHGDFGTTFEASPQPVAHELSQAMPVTIQFVLLAEVLSLILAVPIGVFAAYRENRLGDKVATGASFVALAIPNFVLAIFMVTLLVVNLKWLPLLYTSWSQDPVKNIQSLVIPVIALSAGTIAVFVRLLRSDMIATLQEDFILMARAKGMPPMRILFRHALRPSSFSLLTVAGINLGALIGGTVIVENMFQANGLGLLLVTSIYTRDYPVIQAVVLIVSAVFVAVNVLVDILYSLLDPRIRHA